MGASESLLSSEQAAEEFEQACSNGDVSRVRILLDSKRPGCDRRRALTSRGAFTGFIRACLKGQREVVEVLLERSRLEYTRNLQSGGYHGPSPHLVTKSNTNACSEASTTSSTEGSHAFLEESEDALSGDEETSRKRPLLQKKDVVFQSLQSSLSFRDKGAWLDPSISDNELLRRSCAAKQNEIVALLLDDDRVDPTAASQFPVRIACRSGNLELLRLLLSYTEVDPTALQDDAFRTAAAYGHWQICQELLQWHRPEELRAPNLPDRVDPTTHHNYAIRIAAMRGQWQTCKFLLGVDGVDPAVEDNLPLRLACQNGHAHIVQGLLNDPRVTPNDDALRRAAQGGHSECVRLLLQDPRIDPTKGRYWALRAAYSRNHVETVICFLNDERVNPEPELLNRMLRYASEMGETWLVCLLFEHPRHRAKIDLHVDYDAPLRRAVRNEQIEMVRLLLRKGADASAQQQYAIYKASERGNLEMVELLLFHPHVDPAFWDNRALRAAADDQTFEAILRSKRVQVSLGPNLDELDPRIALAYESLQSKAVQQCRRCLGIIKASKSDQHPWGSLSSDMLIRCLAMAFGHQITTSAWSHGHAFTTADIILNRLAESRP
mmetsp:Transcript_2214/g.5098  ORF Transcript_2214/g.5098 Transcript_2214/m.5098 type:complete len:607 (+) Transcript_2214:515-2335(+)